MLVKKLLTLSLLFGLTACVTTTKPGLPTSVQLPELGDKAVSTIEIANKTFPLPKGTFYVTGTDLKITGKDGYAASVFLVRSKNRKVQQAVEIYTNLPINRVGGTRDLGWATHGSCIRDDMHYRKTLANERLGKQDCWWVNHWIMERTGSRNTEHWKETVKYIEDNKLSAPQEMIGVSYRLANKTDYATLNYFFNPEVKGVALSANDKWQGLNWSDSDWHPDQVKKSKARQNYIADRIKWGTSWHKTVQPILP